MGSWTRCNLRTNVSKCIPSLIFSRVTASFGPPECVSNYLYQRNHVWNQHTTRKLWFSMEQSPNNTFGAIAEPARYFPPLNSNILLTYETCFIHFLHRCKNSITFTAVALLFMVQFTWILDTCYLKVDSLETWSGFDIINAISGLALGLIERYEVKKKKKNAKLNADFIGKVWSKF